MPADARLIPYTFYLIKEISRKLPAFVAVENSLAGSNIDDHQAEAVVQQLIIKLLTPLLPAPGHLVQNEELPRCGNYVPDILVTNIGSGYWEFFELKTLLKDDQLTTTLVEADLEKLCTYKKQYPDAAAIFALVGSKGKLFNPQRKAAWKNLRIQYDGVNFEAHPPQPQPLNSDYVAVPCGSSDAGGDVNVFMWEILPSKAPVILASAAFRFVARMGMV